MIKLLKEYAQSHQTMSDQVAKTPVDDYLTIEAERQNLHHGYLPKFYKVRARSKGPGIISSKTKSRRR